MVTPAFLPAGRAAWRIWLTLVLCVAVASLHAQSFDTMPRKSDSLLDRPLSELHHTAYPDRETSVGALNAVAQSPDGFLWLGGSKGLSRFDGAHFEPAFRELLPNRPIFALFCDTQDDLWVGYRSGGASHLHAGQVTQYAAGVDIPQGTVFSILRGPDGEVWMATTAGVVRQVQGQWQRVGIAQGYDGHQPESMTLDHGVLWLVDVSDAYALKPGASRFERVPHDAALRAERDAMGDPPRPYRPEQDGNGLVDSSGALWLVSGRGFERDRWVHDPDGRARRITESFSHVDGLTGDDAFAFFEDRSGNVWVLTDGGIDQFRATKLRPVALPDTPHSVGLVAGDGNTMLASVYRGGALQLDGARSQSRDTWPAGITALTRDRHGDVWLAGMHGLDVYRDGRMQAIALPAELSGAGTRFQALYVGDDDTLWASVAAFGLYRRKDGAWTKESRAAFPASAPMIISRDARGALWLAYPRDVLLVVSGNAIRRYDSGSGLAVGTPLALDVEAAHVWVGGDNGLFGWDGQRFVRIMGEGGEAFRGISGIVETANGDLWLNGLDDAYRIAAGDAGRALAAPGVRVPFHAMGQDDGRVGSPYLPRPLPSLRKDGAGRLWFATTSSLAWLDPSRMMHDDTPPVVVIDDVMSGDSHYPVRGVVRLPALTRRVEFRYAAASLTDAQRTTFRYRLDGVDDEWQDAGTRRSAFYTSLQPGAYRLHVQAFNEDGVASRSEASVSIRVLPAWYQTWWFKALCVACAVALAWLATLARARKMRDRVRVSLEARHAERERIARELHDTLLQGVQGLLLRMQVWASDEAMPEARRREMHAATTHARDMLVDGRDRIVTLRDGDAPLIALGDALRVAGGDLAFTSTARFVFDEQGSGVSLHADIQREVMEIALEALRNAFMHAGASEVRLVIRYGRRSLEMLVHDDGMGIGEDIVLAGRREGRWGMVGMHERAVRIGAQVTVSCPPEGGTRVRLLVPVHRARRPRRRRAVMD